MRANLGPERRRSGGSLDSAPVCASMAGMKGAESEIVKRREVRFQGPHPDSDQSGSARLLLQDSEGIVDLEAVDPMLLMVTYDVRFMTLQDIESALQQVGFHLDNSLMTKLRRAVWYYADDTQRAVLGCEGNPDCTARVFVNRYQRMSHGCRDDRPAHWRRYL